MNKLDTRLTAGAWSALIKNFNLAQAVLNGTPWHDDRHSSAKTSLNQARDAIRDALRNAEWGNSGSAFITKRALRIEGDTEITLWLNRLKRATLILQTGWVTVISFQEAKREYRTRREDGRARDERYKARLETLAKDLARADIDDSDLVYGLVVNGWVFIGGQNGGFFRNPDGLTVSAPGAMRLAKMENTFDPEWVSPNLYPDADEIDIERRCYGARY